MKEGANQPRESILLTGSYFVSDTRIEIGGRSFDPAYVSEATTKIHHPQRAMAVIVAVFAVFFLLLGAGATSSGRRTVGIAILGVGIITAAMIRGFWRSKYYVVLIDGQPMNFIDMDGKHATEMVAAINKAIAAARKR